MAKFLTTLLYWHTILLITISLLTLSACNKTNEPQPASQTECLLTRMERETGEYTDFQYDDQGKLISFHYFRPKTEFFEQYEAHYTVERNSANLISKVKEDLGNNLGSTSSFEYDSKGKWIKTTHTYTTSSSTYMTLVPEYNAQNKISKITTTSSSGSTTVAIYEYTNGNASKITYQYSSSSSSSSFEYYTDIANKMDMNEYFTITRYSSGSHSPNAMAIKRQIPNGSTITSLDFTYALNSKGFPTNLTVTATSNSGDSYVTNNTAYTYQCK